MPIFTFVLIINSYSDKVTGNVVDEGNNPIDSVSVKLVIKNLTTTTDSAGYFEFEVIVPINHKPIIKNSNKISLYNGKLSFSILKEQNVSIEVCNMKGRVVSRALNKVLSEGEYTVPLFDNTLSHSVYVITIKIGNNSYSFKTINKNNSYFSAFQNTSPASEQAALKGQKSVIDTLTATKDGYHTLAFPIESYNDNYTLTLKKIISGRIVIIISVDWEGSDLKSGNLTSFKNFRDNYPEIPLLQFLNAAYYTKTDANDTDVTNKINSALLPIDEHGLHIHGWKTLFEEAGVVHHRYPSWWYGDTLSDFECSYDCGIDIATSEYTREEICKVIQLCQAIHTTNGFDKAVSFRTGGWMGRNNVLEALKEEGFLYDHSPVETDLITGTGKIPDNTLLAQWLKEMWKDITITSQPFTIIDGLIEVPDNGALADYMGGQDMLDIFKENAKLYVNNPDSVYYVSIGFHQETASNYIARVAQAIDLITEYAKNENIPIEFRTRPY
jgi:hypothetical protein